MRMSACGVPGVVQGKASGQIFLPSMFPRPLGKRSRATKALPREL